MKFAFCELGGGGAGGAPRVFLREHNNVVDLFDRIARQ